MSPYKYGPCWKLCKGLCCNGANGGDDNEYFLEFFPFEDKFVSRRMFSRINRYEVDCGYLKKDRVQCHKTLYCYLSPSHPAFDRGKMTGVVIDPEIENCPLILQTGLVSKKFMKAAFEVWKEVLSELPGQRVAYYKKKYRLFTKGKKIKKVWKFA